MMCSSCKWVSAHKYPVFIIFSLPQTPAHTHSNAGNHSTTHSNLRITSTPNFNLGKMAEHKNIVLGYPQFPEEFRKYLPQGYTTLNVDEKCVCHKCAPRLWAFRFGKTEQEKKREDPDEKLEDSHNSSSKSLKRKRQLKKHTKISRPKLTDNPSELNQIRRSCDYRVTVAIFEAHLQQLCRGLTKQQEKSLQSFEEALDQVFEARKAQDVKLLPKPRSLCEPLDELFFDGCLTSLKYSWSGESSAIHQSTHLGHGCRGVTLCNGIGLPRIIKLNDVAHIESNEGELEVVSTILHEMVHAFLDLYVCSGEPCLSNRIGSKKIDLCKYMCARSVNLFHTVTNSRDEDMTVTETDVYWGHGPIFQHLLRCIFDNALEVIGYDLPISSTLSERFCSCFETPPRCFFHCCDSFEEMQQNIWKYFLRPLPRDRDDPEEVIDNEEEAEEEQETEEEEESGGEEESRGEEEKRGER